MTLLQGDCLELLKDLPEDSVDLVLTDPPYNIRVETVKNGKSSVNSWDDIEDYIPWCLSWLRECVRVLKPCGVLYFWHNSMPSIARLMVEIEDSLPLTFVSFCIWDKGDGYRAQTWMDRDPDSITAPRSWVNRCEYCIHYFCVKPGESGKAARLRKNTGLEMFYSSPASFRPLKDWYAAEKERLGLTDREIGDRYTEVTGKKPHMLRHYFQDSQFSIPTEDIWNRVYVPLGFGMDWEELHRRYDDLRPWHRCDRRHCNVWQCPPVPSQGRLHTCQKPVSLLERIVKVSCRPGGVVLDPFMGSGSTGAACIRTGREFIGMEKDPEYFRKASDRLAAEQEAAENAPCTLWEMTEGETP